MKKNYYKAAIAGLSIIGLPMILNQTILEFLNEVSKTNNMIFSLLGILGYIIFEWILFKGLIKLNNKRDKADATPIKIMEYFKFGNQEELLSFTQKRLIMRLVINFCVSFIVLLTLQLLFQLGAEQTMLSILGAILVLVLSIVLFISYSLVPYLAILEPGLGIIETAKQSAAKMKGQKWKYITTITPVVLFQVVVIFVAMILPANAFVLIATFFLLALANLSLRLVESFFLWDILNNR